MFVPFTKRVSGKQLYEIVHTVDSDAFSEEWLGPLGLKRISKSIRLESPSATPN